MAQPLIDDVSPVMALVFSGYVGRSGGSTWASEVAFSMLAMMNVITGLYCPETAPCSIRGIFVDNAKTYAQQDKALTASFLGSASHVCVV